MSDPVYVARARQTLLLGKKVLFVEGPDDEAVYTKWMEKLDPLFAAQVEIISCDGQQKVVKALTLLSNDPQLFGILDRDEWDQNKIAATQATHPQLLINPDRHTLESYFCDPQEIVGALNNRDAAVFGPRLDWLTGQVTTGLADWVAHGALWTSLMRVQNQMQDAKIPSFFNDVIPIPSDAVIKARMEQWAGIVDDVAMFTAFDALRTQAHALSQSDQLRSRVYSPEFFARVVLPTLQQLQHGDDRTWKVNLAEWSPTPPADLLGLLQTVLA